MHVPALLTRMADPSAGLTEGEREGFARPGCRQ
jgi:hypothetical protein